VTVLQAQLRYAPIPVRAVGEPRQVHCG